MPNTIWIDADALPNKNREVLLKAILKRNLLAVSQSVDRTSSAISSK